VPHLHWHIIPRFEGDPHYPNPIWGESAGGQPFHPEAGFWKIFSQAIKESLDSKV
jgi:diadenosine tetraphosphate (Ap4A) HIT family hydrolase